MTLSLSRREFMMGAAAFSAYTWARLQTANAGASSQRIVVRLDDEIGTIRPELHGHFAEHLGACVYGGLWVGRNSRIPNINGYRRQAVEYLRELGVPVLRWPGGCFADDYHWRDGIGPLGQRPKRVNIHWGGFVEDNSFGTHEFIGLCRLLGAEPYLAGNVGSGSPEELRNWIEYCNMSAGSTLAEERSRDGSPEPFKVRYWGIGNESWGCGGEMRPEVYADHYRRFAGYVREFSGTRPFLIASGPSGNDMRWSRGFLDGLGNTRFPNGWAMHYYTGGRDPALKFTIEHMNEQFAIYPRVEDAIVAQRSLLDSYSAPNRDARHIGLMVDEWGVWDRILAEDEKAYGKLWQQSTLRSALAAGLGLNIFNRQADKLYMCNIAQMVNVLQSLILTDGPEGERCVRTTTYYAFALFKPHRGNTAIKMETPDANSAALSLSASKQANTVVITAVNPRADADAELSCVLRGATAKTATAQLLHDADWNAYNSFEQPNRLVPKSHPVVVEGANLRMDLPRLSLATILVELR